MANTYKLTPRSEKNFTIRLRTLDTRFRVRSCKYPRLVKTDIFNKLESKRRITIRLEPVVFLQRFIYQDHNPRVNSLPIYLQRKLVRRPYIHFDNTTPIKKASTAGYFLSNADDEFNFCRTPFLVFNKVRRNSVKFIFHNNLSYHTDQSLSNRFFTNYSKTKLKAHPFSVWSKRLVHKAEYKSHDLQFLIPNVRTLGYYKFAFLLGSNKFRAYSNQKIFNYPQSLYNPIFSFAKKKYWLKLHKIKTLKEKKKIRIFYKLQFNLFYFFKWLDYNSNTFSKKHKFNRYISRLKRRLLFLYKDNKKVNLHNFKSLVRHHVKMSTSEYLKPFTETDFLPSFFSPTTNPFFSFIKSMNYVKKLYFLFYYNLNKKNLIQIKNVKNTFKSLKTKIGFKLQKHKTINLWNSRICRARISHPSPK